ncbi:MAG: AMP-binding protein [Rhizobiales bacterium]|nr:AMP-binding protein [Hyphomicrobiales bacterium]
MPLPQLTNRHVQPFAGQDIRTLIDLMATRRADHAALIWEPFEGDGTSWSYAAFAEKIRRLAAGLHARGVTPGDRVIVHLDNCPEAIFAWFGCAYVGAVAVTTNARSMPDEMAYFASHSGAVAAITQPRFAAMVKEAAPKLAWIAVTQTDNGEDAGANKPTAKESFDAIDADPATLPERPHDPMAPFGIQYTSGTTSRPKAVLWTHANALWGAKVGADHEDLQPSDVHLITMPLFHTNAQSYSVLTSLWVGATMVVQPRFSASRFWPVSLKHKCTWASMVPFCLRALVTQPVPDQHYYRFWGNGVCEPVTDAHFRVKTIGWWGMTETITHGTVGSAFHPDMPMSMGRVASEYEIRIVNDDGKDAQPGETGDLLIKGQRGLSLFAEYYNNAEATESAYDADGYFITGDRVTLMPDGYLVFADRSKDMLKVGGENVAASEIERVVMTVPGIAEAAVVAKKDPMYDEVPVVFVLPMPGSTASPEAMRESIAKVCAAQLANFKQPREIRIVDSLPRSTLEKIAKAELRKLLD